MFVRVRLLCSMPCCSCVGVTAHFSRLMCYLGVGLSTYHACIGPMLRRDSAGRSVWLLCSRPCLSAMPESLASAQFHSWTKRYQFQQGVFTHTDYKKKMTRKKQASLYTVHETHFSIQEASTKLPIFVADPDSIARILMRSDSNSILALSARFHVAAT